MCYTLRWIHASWPEATPLNITSFSNFNLLGISQVFLGEFLILKDNIILDRNPFPTLKDDILLDHLHKKKAADLIEGSSIFSTYLGNTQ